MACGSVHTILSEGEVIEASWKSEIGDLEASISCTLDGREEETITLEKFVCYSTQLDMPKEKLETYVTEELTRARQEGYSYLEERQKEYMERFWKSADVRIKGNEALQQGIHFNLFHIIQSAGRDGRTGMGAKGLSGEGYEGHYFWDTEMYVLPVLVYTEPEAARGCLGKAMKAIISGIQRCMSCQFWYIPSQRQPDIFWIIVIVLWNRPEAEPESLDMKKVRCIRGERLMGKKLLRITHWEQLSIILMGILLTLCPCIYK